MKVTPAEYEDIQTIYLNAGEMDKDDFCKDWKKHNGSRLLMEYFNQSQRLRDKLDRARDERRELVDWFIKTAHAESSTTLRGKACNMSSVSYVVMRTLQMGLPLWAEDTEWMQVHLEEELRGFNPATRI